MHLYFNSPCFKFNTVGFDVNSSSFIIKYYVSSLIKGFNWQARRISLINLLILVYFTNPNEYWPRSRDLGIYRAVVLKIRYSTILHITVTLECLCSIITTRYWQ